ncbi:MAG: PHB depolymerase family esterase [Candidatus Ozemobacteraceae bacterium]
MKHRWVFSVDGLAMFTLFYFLSLFFVHSSSGAERTGPFRQFLLNRMEQKNRSMILAAEKMTLKCAGRERTYYVHVPVSWNHKDALPVVFLFHGGMGNAKQALQSYGLISKSDEAGFLLVAPNGTGPSREVMLTWNVGFGFGKAQKDHVDDIGFVKAVLDDIEKRYPIDSRRIFATGMSNGAFLCHFLAAQPGNRFAAIAPVVGAIGGKETKNKELTLPSQPLEPVSVMLINGLLDEHIPYEGGLQKKSVAEARFMASASDTVRFWIEADHCNASFTHRYDAKLKATVQTFTQGNNGTEVILYLLHNQGHAWPGAQALGRAFGDTPSSDFPGNELIWEFFKAHPRSEN